MGSKAEAVFGLKGITPEGRGGYPLAFTGGGPITSTRGASPGVHESAPLPALEPAVLVVEESLFPSNTDRVAPKTDPGPSPGRLAGPASVFSHLRIAFYVRSKLSTFLPPRL